MKFKVKFSVQECTGGWYFKITKCGKVLAHSEVYKRKESAKNAVQSIVDAFNTKMVEY